MELEREKAFKDLEVVKNLIKPSAVMFDSL